ncbi:MAG: hypothetical protein K6F95_11165, partial [Selenomonas sp.]|nr:hypothetical protein [Selenomonas sp.]
MFRFNFKISRSILLLPILLTMLLLGSLSNASADPQSKVNPHDSSGFVVLADVVPDIIQEIRYYSTYNFVGDRIDGYNEPIALMTKEA